MIENTRLFGLYLRRLRDSKGLKSTNIALRLDSHQSIVSSIEHGKKKLSDEDCERILKAYEGEYVEDKELEQHAVSMIKLLFEFKCNHHDDEDIAELARVRDKHVYDNSSSFLLADFIELLLNWGETGFAKKLEDFGECADYLPDDIYAIYLFLEAIYLKPQKDIKDNLIKANARTLPTDYYFRSAIIFEMLVNNNVSKSSSERQHYLKGLQHNAEMAHNYTALVISNLFKAQNLIINLNARDASYILIRLKWFMNNTNLLKERYNKKILEDINIYLALSYLIMEEYDEAYSVSVKAFESEPCEGLALIIGYALMMEGKWDQFDDYRNYADGNKLIDFMDWIANGKAIDDSEYIEYKASEKADKCLYMSIMADNLYIASMVKTRGFEQVLKLRKSIVEKYR